MNIGQRINEFDNNFGTVGEFNKLFPYSKLEYPDALTVDIGQPISTKNCLFREITIESKTFEHDFSGSTINYSDGSNAKNNKIPNKFKYVVESSDGTKKEYDFVSLFCKKIGVPESTVNRNIRVNNGTYKFGDYTVTRIKISKKKLKVKKKSYIVEHENGIREVFTTIKDVTDAVNLKHPKRILESLRTRRKHKTREGKIIILKEIEEWK